MRLLMRLYLIRIEATLCGRFYPGFKEAWYVDEPVF
jgi:hypothetical protein